MIPRHRMKVRLLLFCILVTFTRGQEEATRKMLPQRPSERPITEAIGGKASNNVSDRGQPLAVGSLNSRQERTVRDRFQWLIVTAGQTSFSDWNSWRSEHGLLCRSGRQSPVRIRTFFLIPFLAISLHRKTFANFKQKFLHIFLFRNVTPSVTYQRMIAITLRFSLCIISCMLCVDYLPFTSSNCTK